MVQQQTLQQHLHSLFINSCVPQLKRQVRVCNIERRILTHHIPGTDIEYYENRNILS